MYKITSEGKIVALVDEVNYIKISENSGCYIQCSAEEAQGLSINGLAFNLIGHNEIQRDVAINEETTERITAPVGEEEYLEIGTYMINSIKTDDTL